MHPWPVICSEHRPAQPDSGVTGAPIGGVGTAGHLPKIGCEPQLLPELLASLPRFELQLSAQELTSARPALLPTQRSGLLAADQTFARWCKLTGVSPSGLHQGHLHTNDLHSRPRQPLAGVGMHPQCSLAKRNGTATMTLTQCGTQARNCLPPARSHENATRSARGSPTRPQGCPQTPACEHAKPAPLLISRCRPLTSHV